MEEIPFEDRYVPKTEIDWDRSLWWWYPLTRAVHPAMRVTAIVTSAIASITRTAMSVALTSTSRTVRSLVDASLSTGWTCKRSIRAEGSGTG